MFVLHDEPNRAPITDVYAWLSVDPAGNEGIIAAPIPGLGTMPLVHGNRALAERSAPLAAAAVAAVNAASSHPERRARLVRFTRGEEIVL